MRTTRMLYFGAALAFASQLAVATPTELKFCTGGEGGFYESLGTDISRTIVKGTEIKSVVLNTGGSVENAEKLKDQECDIAVVQADAVVTQPLPADVKVVDAHEEVEIGRAHV